MTVKKHAASPQHAATVLALIFENLGDAHHDTPELHENEMQAIFAISVIGAGACGHQLTMPDFRTAVQSYQAWAAQGASPTETFTVFSTACQTLKANWKDKDGYEPFFRGFLMLAMADRELSEVEKGLLPAIITGIGIPQNVVNAVLS